MSPNAELNAGIAASVLSCIPPEPLDASGLSRSLWLLRITSTAEDAARMIEDLLAPQPSDSCSPRYVGRCV